MKKTQRARNFLAPAPLALALVGPWLFYSNATFAQFQKFKSPTQFENSGGDMEMPAAEAPEIQVPPAPAVEEGFYDSSLEEDYAEGGSFDGESTYGDYSNNESPGASNNPSFNSSNTKAQASKSTPAASTSSSSKDVFGHGTGISGVGSSSKKDKKYVNLNPETAFGPEVVTSFDFPNVTLVDLTKHMQKLTGINLIMEKDLKGKISIQAPTPITVGDAWKAYLTALNINGYTLVDAGAFYKIVNARDIRYTPTKIYTGTYTPDTENYVMRIIPLKNIDSVEVSRSFRPFLSRFGRMIEIRQTNTIIIQDTGSNINRLTRLLKFLDVPGHDESLQIFQVKNSSAQEIAKLLSQLLKGKTPGKFTGPTSSRGGVNNNISQVIPEPRTNSIIAMANADGAKELKALIDKLDTRQASNRNEQIHVYYLNHGDAETLAKTLSALVGGATRPSSSRLTRPGSPISASSSDDTLFSNDVKITADKDNNAIVVTASPTDWLTVKNVIGKLDIPRDQVYVEGMIMETQMSRGSAWGVSVLGAYGSGGAQKAGFGGNGTGDLINLLTNNITSLGGLFVGGGTGRKVQLDVPGSSSKVTVNSVNGLITAIASNTDTNVLATPQILVLDNTEGIFEVGESVPVAKTTNATNGSSQTAVEQQNVTMRISITPQINKVTRFVKLKIKQKIEDFSERTTNTTAGGVATTIRNAETSVVVRDRDTIAMGGLMRDRENQKISKVPLLGDIPILGWLFKSKSSTIDKVNLLLFLTPKIMSSYQKTVATTVKDLLNRRAAHMRYSSGEDDGFKTTVKGLYEKAQKQEVGPLYDDEEAKRYINPDDAPSGAAPSDKALDPYQGQNTQTPDGQEVGQWDNIDTPNYNQIAQKVASEKPRLKLNDPAPLKKLEEKTQEDKVTSKVSVEEQEVSKQSSAIKH